MIGYLTAMLSSNNTNKLSPQEHCTIKIRKAPVQIIQINLALKNAQLAALEAPIVQIIQINLALKNDLILLL